MGIDLKSFAERMFEMMPAGPGEAGARAASEARRRLAAFIEASEEPVSAEEREALEAKMSDELCRLAAVRCGASEFFFAV